MSTERKVHPEGSLATEPLAEDVALVRATLAERRADLDEYNPAALSIAATALVALKTRAHRAVGSIRADRSVRYRAQQLAGEHGLPLEDLVAISHEGDLGHAAAVDALRILAQAMGYALTPIEARAIDAAQAGLSLIEETVAAGTAIARDAQDGRIDEAEAHAVRLERVRQKLADTDAAIAPRVNSWKGGRA